MEIVFSKKEPSEFALSSYVALPEAKNSNEVLKILFENYLSE